LPFLTGRRTQAGIPDKIARRVQDLATAEAPFSTGFGIHKQLRALVQAHALYRGQKKAMMNDFEEVKRLSSFMNLDFSPI